MKALSLKQTIELRKWNTNFRGEFLIHSSKNPDELSMKKFGFENLPCGFILGKANLIDVKNYKDKKEFDKDKDFHLADSSWGNFGFILKDIKRIEPISAKGKLNFWDFKENEI